MNHEMQLSSKTGVRMDAKFRDLCEEACMNESSSQIGGPGVTVELDESKIGKRKYHRYTLIITFTLSFKLQVINLIYSYFFVYF